MFKMRIKAKSVNLSNNMMQWIVPNRCFFDPVSLEKGVSGHIFMGRNWTVTHVFFFSLSASHPDGTFNV